MKKTPEWKKAITNLANNPSYKIIIKEMEDQYQNGIKNIISSQEDLPAIRGMCKYLRTYLDEVYKTAESKEN